MDINILGEIQVWNKPVIKNIRGPLGKFKYGLGIVWNETLLKWKDGGYRLEKAGYHQ